MRFQKDITPVTRGGGVSFYNYTVFLSKTHYLQDIVSYGIADKKELNPKNTIVELLNPYNSRYGRKNTFLVAITALIIFGLGVPFSPNYQVFTLLRFLLGMATAGTMVVSFVLVMESVGPRYREVTGCLFQIPFIIGE